jgi:hypothetical protein
MGLDKIVLKTILGTALFLSGLGVGIGYSLKENKKPYETYLAVAGFITSATVAGATMGNSDYEEWDR